MSLMNLLPEDYIAHQRQKRTNLMCLFLFVTVMIGLVGAAVVSERKHKRTREVCERVDKSYEEAGKLIQQMQELDVTRQNMLKKANLTAALLERVPRSYLLAMVTKALPDGASLTSFKLITIQEKGPRTSRKKKTKFKKAKGKNKPSPETPKKMRIEIIITGLAGTDVQVGKFITEIEQCPLIKTVVFNFSQEKKIQDSIMREFEVVLHLKKNADVQNQSPDASAIIVQSDADERES